MEKTAEEENKNDPSRFLGEGITFKAKLIGILEVSEARGDKMCQDALNDLKTAIRAAGEHKQRITISISIDGLRLRDEKTGDCLYHHPVHKISFIAQDMSDSRAFGYIFGSPDTGHRFFGIKTDKTASQVVIAMRDLFQVVFELKKKEIEMAKHHSEQHHLKYGSTDYVGTVHLPKDDCDLDKGKGKYSHLLKTRCMPSKSGESTGSDYKVPTSEAIADLLDLEHELNSIQQGINQMDKITPSDPFGPLPKGELYIDPFDDTFSGKIKKHEEKPSTSAKSQSSQPLDDTSEQDKHSFFAPTASTSKNSFFSQFSPGMGKSKPDDTKWFDQETESLFSETVNVNEAEPTSSPIALNTSAPEPEQVEGKKSPIKTDLFTELDPLGTGRVKPYIDKKDFFQELKNPPKKVLKELLTEGSSTEPSSFYFPANFKEEGTPPIAKSDSALSSSTIDSVQGFSATPKYSKIDPFEDNDPFDKTDPFQEDSFSTSVGFPSIFSNKASTESIFEDKMSWKFDSKGSRDDESKNSPTNFGLIPSANLKVSLPPEKSEGGGSRQKSPPNSPESIKAVRRKNYQVLKQTTAEGGEDSPVQEEPFVSYRVLTASKSEVERRSPFKEKLYSLQSPTLMRNGKAKTYSSVDTPEEPKTPDPPPKGKASLFSIKPPPLPPKKTSQTMFKPPARPPSLEDNTFQYDYVEKKSTEKEELKCVKLKKQLLSGKSSPPVVELKKQNFDGRFPLLPPPPTRKASGEGSRTNTGRKTDQKTSGTPGSVLNLKLNQLDNTGLENLAITLGIPSENIYSMTLQELTKMLAEKYLLSETKAEKPSNDSFEVDFESNFAKMDLNDSKSFSSYDKYAVFKELMENERKASTTSQNENNENNFNVGEDFPKEENAVKESQVQEEDKYAALRQLSLNVQNSENFEENSDGENDERKVRSGGGGSETPKGGIGMGLVSGVLDPKTSWPSESKTENPEMNKVDNVAENRRSSDQDESKEEDFPSESPLFPLADQFLGDGKSNSQKDNWATFEKSDFGESPTKKSPNVFNENETSPISSDGKEDIREIPFHWHKDSFKRRRRKDVPWQDEDESWEDYSPKESFCSDESSHEDRSPDPRRSDRYEKPSWNVCDRPAKTDRKRSEKGSQRSQRGKWNEETEDEFEENWRKQRERTDSYESERKSNFWHNTCDSYNKHYNWCESRNEPWSDKDRHGHCFMNRRKRSESDNEYRKRCDSDTSDKECAWGFKKNYPESPSRSGKQKPYYTSGYSFRDYGEHCHESRPKHRKGNSQKRPSSVSESKRNYEKIPSDYPYRGSDKTFPGKSDTDEYYRYQYTRKEFRHRGEPECSRYYGSSERRSSSQQHSKMGSRTSRGSNSALSDKYASSSKKSDAIETQGYEFNYFEPFSENFKHRKSDSKGLFHFGRESECPPDKSTQERKINNWTSTNGKSDNAGFYTERNPKEGYTNFLENFIPSPKKSTESGKSENIQEGTKAEGKSKPNLMMLYRQESSSAPLRKSDSINIFSRDKDPFEGDDFFSSAS